MPPQDALHIPLGPIGSPPPDRRREMTVVFAFGALVALIGAFLPWLVLPAGVRVPSSLLAHCVADAANLLSCTALHGDAAYTAGVAGTALAVGLFCVWRVGRKALLMAMLLTTTVLLFFGGTQLFVLPPIARAGLGLWLTVAGGVVMAIALLAFTWALNRAPAESMEGPLPIVPG